jgi:hypothetical protein
VDAIASRTIVAVVFMLASPAFAVELFRYRGAAKDGGTLEYVFDAGEQNSPNAVTKEKVADRLGAIFFEAPLHLAISSGGLGGGQIRRVETGHNRMRVLS